MCSLPDALGRHKPRRMVKRSQPERVAERKRNQAIIELDNQATNQVRRRHRGDEEQRREDARGAFSLESSSKDITSGR